MPVGCSYVFFERVHLVLLHIFGLGCFLSVEFFFVFLNFGYESLVICMYDGGKLYFLGGALTYFCESAARTIQLSPP